MAYRSNRIFTSGCWDIYFRLQSVENRGLNVRFRGASQALNVRLDVYVWVANVRSGVTENLGVDHFFNQNWRIGCSQGCGLRQGVAEN
jgi:hypothetical protein